LFKLCARLGGCCRPSMLRRNRLTSHSSGRLRRRLTQALGLMSIATRILVLALVLSLPAWCAAASDTLESNWLGLIKTSLGPSCAVSLTKVGTTVSGNNGSRSEQWFLQTCRGQAEYWVSYYPPRAFPKRVSPYEVQRASPSSSAGRPNQSSKRTREKPRAA